MSPRLMLILALAGILALGAGIVRWIAVQPDPTPIAGTGNAAARSANDAERRAYRKTFLGDDANRDIRGGQEMRPRW